MAGFKCGVCGKIHAGLPMDLAYNHPPEYFRVPPDERQARIYSTADVCVVDDREFLIRGVLELPVKDAEDNFHWGVWALVAQRDFTRYLELWDAADVEDEPPIAGLLSGGIRPYPDSDLLKIWVHLRSNGQRPRFEVVSPEHPLGRDQREGIAMAQVHDFIAAVSPDLLDQPGPER